MPTTQPASQKIPVPATTSRQSFRCGRKGKKARRRRAGRKKKRHLKEQRPERVREKKEKPTSSPLGLLAPWPSKCSLFASRHFVFFLAPNSIFSSICFKKGLLPLPFSSNCFHPPRHLVLCIVSPRNPPLSTTINRTWSLRRCFAIAPIRQQLQLHK